MFKVPGAPVPLIRSSSNFTQIFFLIIWNCSGGCPEENLEKNFLPRVNKSHPSVHDTRLQFIHTEFSSRFSQANSASCWEQSWNIKNHRQNSSSLYFIQPEGISLDSIRNDKDMFRKSREKSRGVILCIFGVHLSWVLSTRDNRELRVPITRYAANSPYF